MNKDEVRSEPVDPPVLLRLGLLRRPRLRSLRRDGWPLKAAIRAQWTQPGQGNVQILGIDHVVLRCRDLGVMLRFYTDVLGCSVTKRNERMGIIHLRAGLAQIDLAGVDGELGMAGGAPPGKEGHNVDHICLRIEPFDLETLRVHFLNHGIDLGAVHHNFGAEGYGSAVYLKDPEGNSIELKGPSVQQAGRDDA